jgi:hypothetical protein
MVTQHRTLSGHERYRIDLTQEYYSDHCNEGTYHSTYRDHLIFHTDTGGYVAVQLTPLCYWPPTGRDHRAHSIEEVKRLIRLPLIQELKAAQRARRATQ